MPPITAEYVRARLDYDPETGVFTWRARPDRKWTDRRWNNRYAGKRAGSQNRLGYWRITFDHKTQFQAANVAWLLMTGEWPSKTTVYHINRDPSDNRWKNLREATPTQQNFNRRRYSTNTSGTEGVSFDRKAGKWAAYINANNRRKFLGYFDKMEAAAIVRKAAEAQFRRI